MHLRCDLNFISYLWGNYPATEFFIRLIVRITVWLSLPCGGRFITCLIKKVTLVEYMGSINCDKLKGFQSQGGTFIPMFTSICSGILKLSYGGIFPSGRQVFVEFFCFKLN